MRAIVQKVWERKLKQEEEEEMRKMGQTEKEKEISLRQGIHLTKG